MDVDEIVYRPIGFIRTDFTEPGKVPRQAALNRDVKAVVELAPVFEEALEDLEGFSRIILIYHLHQSEGFNLKAKPPVDTRGHGLFATRSPRRPNPIGIAFVELERIEGRTLHIRGADMLDMTPVLDIKPYIPRTDSWPDAVIGWLTDIVEGMADVWDAGPFGGAGEGED